MRFIATVILSYLAVLNSAAQPCTEGRSWTKAEFAQYQELKRAGNMTALADWPGLSVIPHCTIEVDSEENMTVIDDNRLDRRSVNNFGCGMCVTSLGPTMAAGWLWREWVGGDYPSADYFTGTYCASGYFKHHEIPSGQHASCFNPAPYAFRSVLVYQGC
ncbi:hypothetical protein V8F33_004685 [Rhypophila sp. PSN 637]